MEVNEIDSVTTKFNQMQNTFGYGGAILILIIAAVLILTWRYLIRRSEVIAEQASEKTLRKFQSQLDQDLVKFQTKHQKQIDAVHDTFQKLQQITSTIQYLMKGEKFTQHTKAEDALSHLIHFRHDFKDTYRRTRLVFPEELCVKIDSIIPAVDIFIETFNDGLLPEKTREEKDLDKEYGIGDGLYIAGIWQAGAFDETLRNLEQISKEIEVEFRKIYGTNG